MGAVVGMLKARFCPILLAKACPRNFLPMLSDPRAVATASLCGSVVRQGLDVTWAREPATAKHSSGQMPIAYWQHQGYCRRCPGESLTQSGAVEDSGREASAGGLLVC